MAIGYFTSKVRVNQIITQYQNITLLLICCLFWILYCLYTGTIKSGYHFMDDHMIVSIGDKLQTKNIFQVCNYFINDYEGASPRFRPFYWIVKVLEVQVLGINIYVHSWYLAILGGLTSFFLFQFAKNIGFTLIEAVLFVLIVLIGEQSENWWMTGAAENRGMLFMSLGLYIYSVALIKGKETAIYKIIFCFLILISSLSKESFILLIPSLLSIRILLPIVIRKQSFLFVIKENWVVTIFLLFLMAIELLHLSKLSANIGYAGFDSSLSFLSYYRTLESYFISNSPIFIAVNIFFTAGLILIIKIKAIDLEGLIDRYLLLVIIMTLVIIPQVFLYTKSGLVGRYLIPISLGLAFFMIAPVNYVRSFFRQLPLSYNFILTIVILSPSLLLLSNRFKESNSMAYAFSYRGYENDIIRSIDKNTLSDTNKIILIVVDPTLIPTVENQIAMDVYIKKLLKKSNPIYFQLISMDPLPHALSGFQKDTYEMVLNQSKGRQINNISNKLNISNIIIFQGLEDKFLNHSKDWFVAQKYKRTEGQNFTHYYE